MSYVDYSDQPASPPPKPRNNTNNAFQPLGNLVGDWQGEGTPSAEQGVSQPVVQPPARPPLPRRFRI